MSKNVAVFVDVANIFYAAKAAGIDIDYVTLLKSATAGRDFVRAYAYTGLDPENENQRQFHSFLARNGYRVISKDIRKYGDGRIKANLDIELVVDLMKTARNLDIAVVVSGDGDFAPALRAVQEMGVRCEVISFRGNTSSDLIEVADQFTDIAQIARVEKSSARSGRRVAAEGDLSMTEVPEKETEGAPRRRRGGGRTRDERPAAAVDMPAAAAGGAGRGQGNLIVLPGERLSRSADGEVEDGFETVGEEAAGEGEYAAGSENGREAALDGQRRRRRRGGRGRGRGRRPDGEAFEAPEGAPAVAGAVAGAGAEVSAGVDADEDEEFEDVAPAQPPHQTFGSVWDSQIGVPTTPVGTTAASYGGGDADDEDLDEPEVPEYLLAERRQRGQRPGGGGGRMPPRGRSAYQAALDRERFGSGARQQSGFGANSGTSGGSGGRPARGPDRGQDRGRDRGRGGRPQGGGGRPMDRAPRVDDRQMTGDRRSAEPWSEVPPEIEEMLRQEIARKSAPPEPSPASATRAAPEMPESTAPESPAAASDAAPEAEAPIKPARRTRTSSSSSKASTAKASTDAGAADAPTADEPAEQPAAEAAAPKRRTTTRTTTRTRATKATAAKADADAADATDAPAAPAESAEAPAAKPATRRRRAATAPAAEES